MELSKPPEVSVSNGLLREIVTLVMHYPGWSDRNYGFREPNGSTSAQIQRVCLYEVAVCVTD